jgi:hypothetical protein
VPAAACDRLWWWLKHAERVLGVMLKPKYQKTSTYKLRLYVHFFDLEPATGSNVGLFV